MNPIWSIKNSHNFCCYFPKHYTYHTNYKIYPGNYIAYDIKHGTRRFAKYYTPEVEQQFALYLVRSNAQFDVMGVDKDAAREILLGIYANPVEAKLNMGIDLD